MEMWRPQEVGGNFNEKVVGKEWNRDAFQGIFLEPLQTRKGNPGEYVSTSYSCSLFASILNKGEVLNH